MTQVANRFDVFDRLPHLIWTLYTQVGLKIYGLLLLFLYVIFGTFLELFDHIKFRCMDKNSCCILQVSPFVFRRRKSLEQQ